MGCYFTLAPSDCPQGIQAQSLTLSIQLTPSCPAPAYWWWKWVSGLLLCWELQLGTYSLGFFVFVFVFPSLLSCPLRFQISSQTRCWEGFLLFGNFSFFMTPSPGQVSVPNCFVSLLYFVLPPFEENGLPFWVPGVFCQCSEVVLWKLFSIQMIFWWICEGESGLFVLFLYNLRTAHHTSPHISFPSSFQQRLDLMVCAADFCADTPGKWMEWSLEKTST